MSLGAAARQVPDPNVQKIGPQVGETVPDFELIDQNGATRTLKSLLGPNGAMLVFFRAGRAALRPAVITRKTCGSGNRTPRGAQTQQVLASVLRTAQQRGLDATDLIASLLTAPIPVGLDVLRSTALH